MLEKNGEKKNGCWNKNGLEKNGEKNSGRGRKNASENDSEKKNPLEKNGEKKNGCWKMNGLEKNGEKNGGCEKKNGLEKDSEKKNPLEKNGGKKNGCWKKNGLEKNDKKNSGRGKKNGFEKNAEENNDREERRTCDLGITNCGILAKWMFPSMATDLKGGRGTNRLMPWDRKGGRGTNESLPGSLKGGRGTRRPAPRAGGWICCRAIGADGPLVRSRANAPGAAKPEPNRRATSETESRSGSLVLNELLGIAFRAVELNSGHPWKLPMDRMGEARGPYGEKGLTNGPYPPPGRNCALFMRVITGPRPKPPCEPNGLVL